MGVTVLLWASAFVAIRHVGDAVSPAALTLGRCLVASLLLGLLLARRHRRAPVARPSRRDGVRLLLIGVLWFGLYNVALNAAEQRVDAGTAAMLVNIGPLLVAVLAAVVLGEGFPRHLVVGSVVAFGGVVLIGVATARASGAVGAGADAQTVGAVLCLVAAVAYAVSVVAQKPLLARMPALQVTWIACTVGAVACLPAAPNLVRELAAADLSTSAWVVYLGVGPSAVAFTTWAYALARTSAGRLGSTTYLVPAIASLLAWGLLGEVPAALSLVGGVVCLLGVAVARRAPRATRRGSAA
ncbi:multidrug transporter [Angustibacter sp. Root456]|nr:multidrug transporter [Angustibacter sp. Root456]